MEKINSYIDRFSKKLQSNPFFVAGVIFVGLLLIFGIVQSKSSIKSRQEELLQIQEQCEQQRMENEALSELLENSDAEYIEQMAREELDYVLPGERVYIVRPGE